MKNITKKEKQLLVHLLENDIDKMIKRKATLESVNKVVELREKFI